MNQKQAEAGIVERVRAIDGFREVIRIGPQYCTLSAAVLKELGTVIPKLEAEIAELKKITGVRVHKGQYHHVG